MRKHLTYAGEGHWLKVTFFLTLVTMLFHATVSTAALSSDSVIVSHCEAPAVREGDNATLTCHFDSDLKGSKQGVKIVQYNSQTFDKTVLVCLWHFDKASCIKKYGFTMYSEVSNELRLNIPRVTKVHAGTYACVVFDSEERSQQQCFLNVLDGPAHPFDAETYDGCRGSALGCDREKLPALFPMLIAASILVVAVIILMIGITVIVCKRYKSHQPLWSEENPYKAITEKTSDKIVP